MRSKLVLVLLFISFADSKVDNSFDACSEYCYKGLCPRLIEETEKKETYKKICQSLGKHFHFATLYMPENRIPLFSAYRLDYSGCENPINVNPTFIEPQLFCVTESDQMIVEFGRQADWKVNQAVFEDYRNTGYEIGHLNPASYHCDNEGEHTTYARTATFTLTNAVPQDPSFNQLKWKAMEQTSNKTMQQKCNFKDAKSFFVTGVIPSDMFIPFPEHDGEGYQQRDYYRVNVPSAMWTAACCDAGRYAESFSFSYYGQNGPHSYIMAMPITRLLHLLRLNGLEIKEIFKNNCMQENVKSKRVLDMLVKVAKDMNAHSFAKLYTDHALDQHTFWH